ncbi:MAG: SDR family NAD(P)-dependent oxidoreductase [Caulobacteraceae bacterium]
MDLSGKTILITGSTDGLGKAVAIMAAAQGARVLLHGRSEAKGAAALAEIREATGNEALEFFRADLASLDEVRALAAAVKAAHGRLDGLVNNAGIALFAADQGREESRDGHELHFAVNYLAPFLLTRLLLDALKAAAPSRIVNVASVGQAPIDFEDVMLARDYSGRRGYSQSKLAQIMFTIDLAERLKGTGVTVTALHPATFMATNMVVGAGFAPISTIRDGAEPTFRLIASDEVEGETGLYYNQFNPARANDQAYDAAARARLWSLSSVLAGLPED